MATAEELADQARAASTPGELDAIAGQAEGRKTVEDAVATRRAQLTSEQGQQPATQPAPAPQRQVIRERTVVETNDPPPGPNATTDPPEGQYFIASDGKTEVNAWGEKRGSDEDKRRRAGGGIA